MNTRHRQIKRAKPRIDLSRRKEMEELKKYIYWDGNNGILASPDMPEYLKDLFEQYRQHIEEQKKLYPRYLF